MNDLILIQGDAPMKHCTAHQIATDTGIQDSSVCCIIRQDLWLKCLEKRRAQHLTTPLILAHDSCFYFVEMGTLIYRIDLID